MKLFKLCCLSLLFFISCSFAGHIKSNESEGRIINGVIEGGTIAYVVSITENDEHFCGGFIFNNRTVITTAYCVEGKTVSSLKVVVRQWSLIEQDPGEEKISVFKVNINENYNNSTRFNDIAIIQLSKELSLAPYVYGAEKPSCIRYDEVLPSQQTPEDATIAGWGATEVGGLSAQKLRSGTVNITSNSNCVNYYGSEYDGTRMICGSNIINSGTGLATGPCNFDEGAPLTLIDTKVGDFVVVGIFSKNHDCNIAEPSIYTRLSTYYAWINNVAGAQPSDCTSGPIIEQTTVDNGPLYDEATL